MKRKTVFVILAAAFTAAVVLSFSACETEVNPDFDYEDFTNEQAAWNASKPENYQFHYEYLYDMSGIVRTTMVVKKGASVEQIPDEEMTKAARTFTIDDLYEEVLREYFMFNNTTVTKSEYYLESIDITWDREQHIPCKVTMHYYVPKDLADQNTIWGYTVSAFKALE